jgi:hypothetical protein
VDHSRYIVNMKSMLYDCCRTNLFHNCVWLFNKICIIFNKNVFIFSPQYWQHMKLTAAHYTCMFWDNWKYKLKCIYRTWCLSTLSLILGCTVTPNFKMAVKFIKLGKWKLSHIRSRLLLNSLKKMLFRLWWVLTTISNYHIRTIITKMGLNCPVTIFVAIKD